MTPRTWDDIANAFDRLVIAGHRKPISNADHKALRVFGRMRAKVVKRRKIPTTDIMRALAKRDRARSWAEHCRSQARRAALRIDRARPHPTTTGPVANDRLPSDAMLARFDRQRLAGARARAGSWGRS